MPSAPLLSVSDLRVTYAGKDGPVHALKRASFSMQEGQTLAVVGESGSGKSTLARAILGLAPVTAGRMQFDGTDLRTMSTPTRKSVRRDIQMIFQDPGASLNPRMTCAALLREPLMANDVADPENRIEEIAELCALPNALLQATPAQLSGGQKQRVAIARSLVLSPRLIIADEPLSALDVSIQAQLAALLLELKAKTKLSIMFISHDLALVRQFCDEAIIMYDGHIVERGCVEDVLHAPLHPYTGALVAASPDPRRPWGKPVLHDVDAQGDTIAHGCPLQQRCPRASTRCTAELPPDDYAGSGPHVAACYHPMNDERVLIEKETSHVP